MSATASGKTRDCGDDLAIIVAQCRAGLRLMNRVNASSSEQNHEDGVKEPQGPR
jgi:hypothetical protein